MKRIILILTSFLSTLVTLSAQEPRVCDYVSLKHALKGKECEVVKTASYYYNEDTVLVEHTKEEIGTEVLNGHGKAISAGCFLIDRNRWDEFMGYFNRKSRVAVVASRNGITRPWNKNINIKYELELIKFAKP